VSCFLKDLTDALAAQITPQTKVKVVYGDEGFGRVVESGPHVQILEDPGGDEFDKAPTTQGGATPSRFRKWTGVLVRIKGASSKPGAKLADHRGVVEAIADLVVVSVEEVAHAHSQNVRNITGTTVDDLTDDIGDNAASAYYQLRFKYARALNKAKAISALEGLVVDRSVIAHRMVIAPTDGSAITSVSPVVVNGLAGIDPSFVGKTLTLDGGTAVGNRGDFSIDTVLDDSSVQITNANASIDTGLSWAVSDDEPAQES
jgi:hypothetical protein